MPECPGCRDVQGGASRNGPDDAPAREFEQQPAPPSCGCPALWKVAVVVVLVAAVAGIMASKTRGCASPTREPVGSDVGPQAGRPAQSEAKPGAQAEPEMVLATVNGEQITLTNLQQALQDVPAQYRSAFENNQHELLEQLVARTLLLQEARSSGTKQSPGERNAQAGDGDSPPQNEAEIISDLLEREVLNHVEVSDADARQFYEQHGDEMPGGRSYEELKDSLRSYALQERQNEAIQSYLAKLRATANITHNEAWVEAQKALAADNPLDVALKTGRPVVADFGRGTCIPCKMMKPILDELQEDYKGRAEILIIQIDEYPTVTQRVGIRVIPTQIFYDASGTEVYRHEGFIPREDIVAKLAEMGVK